MQRQLSLLLPVILAAAGCAAAPDVDGTAAEDQAAVASASEAYADGWRTGDASALAALLTENAVVSVPQQPDLRGRATALNAWRAMLATSRVTTLETRPEPIVVSGDLAIEAGEYDEVIAVEGEDSPVNLNGRYVIVWQRQEDGAWRILRFMALDRPQTES